MRPGARRITGRHPVTDGPGAVLELPSAALDRVVPRVRAGLAALGWEPEPRWRVHALGASLGIAAPPDLLEVAVALLEWAESEEDEATLDRLGELARRREEPALRALHEAFPGRVFVEGERVVVGQGVHARAFSREALPDPAELGEVRGVPVALITGTNGKTTTTRLLAHLAACAGKVVGLSSSDAVVIGGETVERGDWTGPGAARRVLTDGRVEVAVLETARGGVLRRGLAVEGADVAVLTNVTAEHLGQWGIDDLYAMARTKLTLALALRPGGTLVLPAASEPIRAVLPEFLGRRPDLVVRTFSSRSDGPPADGRADDRWLIVPEGRVPLAEIPITFQGTARHNVENALCATLAALALGVPGDAIGRGLRSFRPSVADNPGRMNTFVLPSGALVVLDFAHSYDGLLRVAEAVRPWPRGRRTLLLGQAGDRTDRELLDFGASARALAPARVVLKEVPGRRYERAAGEVPAVLRRGLLQGGLSSAIIEGPTPDEPSGLRLALLGVGPDDLVVALLHDTLAGALAVLAEHGAEPVDV